MKFKVGDFVRIIKYSDDRYIGVIGKVAHGCGYGTWPYSIDLVTDTCIHLDCLAEYELEKIPEKEVLAYLI